MRYRCKPLIEETHIAIIGEGNFNFNNFNLICSAFRINSAENLRFVSYSQTNNSTIFLHRNIL